jgi:DNA-binding Xre family transcriptional regulator
MMPIDNVHRRDDQEVTRQLEARAGVPVHQRNLPVGIRTGTRARRESWAGSPGCPREDGSRARATAHELRLRLGVSQGQLARKMGITQPAIAKIEALRVKNLRFRTVSRAVGALGASLQMTIVPNAGRASSTKQPAQARKTKAGRKEEGK